MKRRSFFACKIRKNGIYLNTEIINIDTNNIDISKIKRAAYILRNGGLVAFPTETVYGLGANALDAAAVEGIYKAKGRPSDNPLIVHVSKIDEVNRLVREIPGQALKLMETFWPGPITIIMPKSEIIPDIITAGLDTVGIRMPSHPVALALIREAGVPVAAPSANTSGKPSPTRAEHVIDDLYGKVDAIIDAGPVSVGVESTVIDITGETALVLRPGGISREKLAGLLGKVQIDPGLAAGQTSQVPKAPGMKYTHYSPDAKVIVVEGETEKIAVKIAELAKKDVLNKVKIGIMATDETIEIYKKANELHDSCIVSMGSRHKPEEIAASLFDIFRHMDKSSVDIIYAEAIDISGIGLAVMNRMKKAASYIIKA